MSDTYTKHNEFKESMEGKIWMKLNSAAHKKGVFIETRQRNSKGHWKLTRWVYDDNIDVLILGNDKVRYYFKRDSLLEWLSENKERLGHYQKGQTEGIPLTIKEASYLCDFKVGGV